MEYPGALWQNWARPLDGVPRWAGQTSPASLGYSTATSAQDLEALRRALGSTRWMDAVIDCSAPNVTAERFGFSAPDASYRGFEGLRDWFRDRGG